MESTNKRNDLFTPQLALVDAIPVVFFGIAAILLGVKLRSGIFFAGALLCFLAGFGKVLWKFLIALAGKDVELLGKQLRYVMPAGFLLMIAGVVMADGNVVSGLLDGARRMPSLMFFIIAVCALAGMVICARKFDRHDVRGNWIEQGINIIAQGCVLLGVWFI
jgi:hypothetical protein